MAFNKHQHFRWDELAGSGAAGGFMNGKVGKDLDKVVDELDASETIKNTLHSYGSNAATAAATGSHFNALEVLGQSFGNSAAGNATGGLVDTTKQTPLPKYDPAQLLEGDIYSQYFPTDQEAYDYAQANNLYSPIPKGGAYGDINLLGDMYDSVVNGASSLWNRYGDTLIDTYGGISRGFDGFIDHMRDNTKYVRAIRHGVGNAIDSTIDMLKDPLGTVYSIGQTVGDGYMAIADLAFGYSTESARERNAMRGMVINDGIERFQNGDGATRLEMLTEFGASALLGGGALSAEYAALKMAGKGAMRTMRKLKPIPFHFIESDAGTLGMNGGGIKLVRSGEHEYLGELAGPESASNKHLMPPNSGPQLPGFKNEFELADHFRRHSKDFKGYYKDPSEYLSGAHDVIKHGIEVEYRYAHRNTNIDEMRRGFVKFMGTNKKGHSKFEFVGTNLKGDITTYHVQTGKDFWRTINANLRDKVIRPHLYN